MHTPEDTAQEAWNPDAIRSEPIPLEQLVQDVYAGSAQQTQEHMLAQLVGKVYEAAPADLQTRLVAQLLRPVGVLAMIVIAGGVFSALRLRDDWPNLTLRSEDLQAVRAVDVAALAEHVLGTHVEVSQGLVHLLRATLSQDASGAAPVLLALLMRRTQLRRASDAAGANVHGSGAT